MKNNALKSAIFGGILVISIAGIPLITLSQDQPEQTQKKRSTWEAILTIIKGSNETTGGSRTGLTCLVSPGILEQKNVIWNTQPFFLWQQNNAPLEIRLYNLNPERQVIWKQEITQTSADNIVQGIEYTGQPLEPNKIYDWEIFNLANNTKVWSSFQIMNPQERAVISEELKRLESDLINQQATVETIALERANYFAERQMWSDALQEMYTIKDPSTELTQKRQELINYFCNFQQQRE